MDEPFNQEAVMNQAENYYDNPSYYVGMSIDEDLLNDNSTDDLSLKEIAYKLPILLDEIEELQTLLKKKNEEYDRLSQMLEDK